MKKHPISWRPVEKCKLDTDSRLEGQVVRSSSCQQELTLKRCSAGVAKSKLRQNLSFPREILAGNVSVSHKLL